MDTDLNSQDRKDLDKFIKFFALKVIVLLLLGFMHAMFLPMFYHEFMKAQNKL